MIAVLSDFGNSEYLGVMKGVMYHIAEHGRVVDLCNTIHSQQVKEGAWVLKQSYKYFPKNTIFLCVVDPGVGGERKGVVIRSHNFYFVGPDNGLMVPAAEEDGILNVVELVAGEHVSPTFHGRDVFAVAAAKLEKGIEISAVGKEAKLKESLSFRLEGRKGEVVRVDHFGNIITNVPAAGKTKYRVKAGNYEEELTLYGNYEAAPEGKLFLVTGSADTLEISIKSGRAAEQADIAPGSEIEIR